MLLPYLKTMDLLAAVLVCAILIGKQAAADDVEKVGPGGGATAESVAETKSLPTKNADEAEAEVAGADIPADAERRLRFSFRYAPWKNVLDWFAEQADLSLILDAPPAGTFNYSDNRAYTPAEAIDVLNSVLLTKGYTLVRHQRMLMLINLDDGIPPNLVTHVDIERLGDVGEFELVSCLFQLEKMTSEEAEEEIAKLLGPQGSVVTMPKAQQILVTETGGRLRTIQRVIERIENPAADRDQQVVTMPLQNVTAEEVLVVARQLLGLPEDQNSAPDGSIRIATDPLGTKIFATGEPKMVQRFKEVMKLVDVPVGLNMGEGTLADPPQLEVYTVSDADPAAVLEVMQTLMAGLPDVRLATDAQTGNLIALARPSQHATIKATLEQMQRDGQQVEVIQLRIVDPQLAVLSINKLFGGGEAGTGQNAPLVDADPVTRQLLIRGTQIQIAQIRTLLEKMGETDSEIAALDDARGGNVRMLPITGSTAQNVLDQVQHVWPTMRRNRVRVVTPSRSIRSVRPAGETTDPLNLPALPPGGFRIPSPRETSGHGSESPPATATPSSTRERNGNPAAADEPVNKSASVRPSHGATFFFVAAQPGDDIETEVGSTDVVVDDAREEDGGDDDAKRSSAPSEIIVSVGPGGIMIASEDLDALDEFEDLITALADRLSATGEKFTVFYLKYARADVAAQLLEEVLGGGGDTGGGGSLLGDLAGNMLGGGGGGGMMGALLGLGGGGDLSLETTGAVTVVPDLRLNALIVQANPTDVDLIEQLLQVIDQEASPETVETIPPPKIIPVYFTNANEVAATVQQVFSRQIATSTAGGQRQPSPEEFIRALRGGRGGSSRSDRQQREQQMMTVGVDTRSNSLVVSAPEALLRQVEALVAQLDRAGGESEQTMKPIVIRRADPAVVQQALNSLLGGVRSSSPSRSGTTGTSRSSTGVSGQPNGSPSAAAQFQQRMQMLNAVRGAEAAVRPPTSSVTPPTSPTRPPIPASRGR